MQYYEKTAGSNKQCGMKWDLLQHLFLLFATLYYQHSCNTRPRLLRQDKI